jgi:cytochrome c biogenesis protein CcdA
LSFEGAGSFLALFGFALGLDGALIRNVAALVMTVFGLVLLAPSLQRKLVTAMTPLVGGGNERLARFSPEGLSGQFLLGLLLGLVWTPCAGPTLGAAVGLAAHAGTAPAAALVMLVFALGAGGALLSVAYVFRGGVKGIARVSRSAKLLLGGGLALAGILILSGWDKALESRLVALSPPWLTDLVTRF